MKNVILYVRVSTDEQANKGFSLRDQEEKLVKYCNDHHLTITEIFREDYSAKTFNRPEMKKLIGYCRKNHKNIDELLFIKWDRFSRNTAESYNKINLFQGLGINVNAITLLNDNVKYLAVLSTNRRSDSKLRSRVQASHVGNSNKTAKSS